MDQLNEMGEFRLLNKNINNISKQRGKHDKWSLKDVPISILSKPTNFNFLYNSNAMSNYYNKLSFENRKVNLNGSATKKHCIKVKTSQNSYRDKNIGDLKQILMKNDRKYGTIIPSPQKKRMNRSFDMRKTENPMQTFDIHLTPTIKVSNKSKLSSLRKKHS